MITSQVISQIQDDQELLDIAKRHVDMEYNIYLMADKITWETMEAYDKRLADFHNSAAKQLQIKYPNIPIDYIRELIIQKGEYWRSSFSL